ncbi:MAG: Grx4 family monothiol glutaredoxin [Azoarcus sp.]|jgi:monothiol glutaredoxin|nr:Grx4 family monothiol glutaredoxin [Azoarcus sp.]
MNIQDRIREQVTSSPVVLYMKGTPQFPQCGFSSSAVLTLKSCGVEDFAAINVLVDQEIRQGIKEYANWPTIPQLYIKGEFIGGSDIMREMQESGELQALLKEVGAIA